MPVTGRLWQADGHDKWLAFQASVGYTMATYGYFSLGYAVAFRVYTV